MNMARGHLTLFTVEGNGEFPIDMLRYDSCRPYAEYDSKLIADGAYVSGRRRLILAKDADSVNWHPTYGRWESFGWKVIAQALSVHPDRIACLTRGVAKSEAGYTNPFGHFVGE
jgi:hypothetical protein